MESFYYKISGVMEDLIIGLVALGILVVSFEYVQFYMDFRDQITFTDFSQRLLLFITVVMFTAYYFVAYSAYFSNANFDKTCDHYSARRMVVMYLLDLIAITVSSWLYAVLLIGVLTSVPSDLPNSIKQITLSITLDDMDTVFKIMFVWHTIVAIWYFVAMGDKKDKLLHIRYIVIYFVLIVCESFCTDEFLVWIFILTYLLLVLSLYYFKGVPDIQKSIDSHKKLGC